MSEKITFEVTDQKEEITFSFSEAARGPQGEPGAAATVDQTIIDGSANAVSGNAVFDGLALKAPIANPTFTGIVTAPRITGRCDGLEVFCKAGLAINAGQVVYVTGASGNNIIIGLAQANAELTSNKTIGVSESTLANNGTGYVITEGLMTVSISAPSAVEGDPIWLSPSTAGGMVFGSANKPVAPNHMVYLGVITRKTGNNVVEIYVKIQNGSELDELSDVLITSPTAGQALMRGATNWENRSLVATDISDSTTAGRALLTAADAAAQRTSLGLGTAATTASTDYATAAQGALADSAVQPGDLATVATTGAYADLSGTPDLSGYATTTELADYLPLAGGTMDDNAEIVFNNGSKIGEGVIEGGGNNGIALTCTVGYELKWEAGKLYVMGDGGTTIRVEQYGFSTAPTSTDDDTKGYVIGSRRILDDGTVYVCTDATTSSAVWVYQGIRDIAGLASINQDTRKLIASDGATEMLNWSSSTNIAIPIGITLGVDMIYDADSPLRYIDVANGELGDYNGATYTPSIDWANRDLYHSDGSYSLSWQIRKLYDSAGVEALDWSGTYAGVYIDRAGGAGAGAVIYSASGTGVDASSGSSWGAYIQSNSGTGAEIFSNSGTGAEIYSTSGTAYSGIGAKIYSDSNWGAEIYSDSSIGARIYSTSGIGAKIYSDSSWGAEIYSNSNKGAKIYSDSGFGATIETNSGSLAADIYNAGSGIGASIYSVSGDHLNVGGGLLVVANNGDTTLTGLLIAEAVTATPNTVAALTGGEGTIAYVNDADTPVIGSAVVGGGSAKCLVCYNGTSWIVTSLL
jgi:hypothetical protein